METATTDKSIVKLNEHKDEWAQLPIPQKVILFHQVLKNMKEHAQAWVDIANRHKQIEADSPWSGEEWFGGISALAAEIHGYIETLDGLAEGRMPKLKKVWKNSYDHTVLHIYPNNKIEAMILSGITAEAWMQQGVTEENVNEHMALFYKQKNPEGKVALVLGAGNVNCIPLLDALYRLIAHGQVVLLKINPINEYLGPIWEEIFEPFISAGYMQFAYGGADVGNYLVHHPDIHEIHLTGSARTHDAIVFGTGEEGLMRKERNEPILKKPITSELGCVSPLIIVPGKWSEKDIQFQAERVVTTKLHNGGFNCVASQVMILPEKWELKDKFLDAVRDVFRKLPARSPWYPGSAERQKAALALHPEAETFSDDEVPSTLIAGIAPDALNEHFFNEESFCTVLAQTSLPGDTPAEFLQHAVVFCNERLQGTLGASIIAHPDTMKELGEVLDRAVADLRYGAIGVNIWNAMVFTLHQAPWGAYAGHTLNDIQSGIGVVHNTFLLDKVEKTVVSGPFYSRPKPPWFVTNKTAHITGRRLAYLSIDKKPSRIPGVFISALRG